MFRGLIVALAGTFLALVAGALNKEPFETLLAPDSLLLGDDVAPPPTTQAPRGVLLAVPAWVRFGKQRSSSAAEQARNRRVMTSVNAAEAARPRTVGYGDSIPAFHQADHRAWNRYFEAQDAHMGMGGSTVPELAWRIMKGGELPRRAPRNAVFLIGTNDVRHGRYDPTPLLEELVRWYARAFPTTKIYVHALLPTTRSDVGPTNAKYRQMAARVGVSFVDCGEGLDPTDRRLFSDGLHPTRQGHERILACLQRELSN